MNFFQFDLMKEMRGKFSISFASHLMKQLEIWKRDGEEVVEKHKLFKRLPLKVQVFSEMNRKFVSIADCFCAETKRHSGSDGGRDECTKRKANNG